ncbi:TPA: hypothetical protein NG682_000994 [Vibrio parahaemolyticus]|uniref:hypothetical protein n=1 Tax=Vibrio TaxID=662 RepID=UPI000ADFA8BE
MNLAKLVIVVSVLSSMNVFANETQTIDTALGAFQVQDMGRGISLSHNYQISLGNKSIGATDRYIELKAYDLGVARYTGGLHSVLVKGYPSGNACAEVYSVMRFKEDYQFVSQSLNVCGGAKSIRKNGSIVIIEGLERDEVTKVKYVVNSDQVSKNGKPYSSGHKFLD